MVVNKECLWIQWIHHYYIKTRGVAITQIPKSIFFILRKITASKEVLLHGQTRQDMLETIFEKVVYDNWISIKKMTPFFLPIILCLNERA